MVLICPSCGKINDVSTSKQVQQNYKCLACNKPITFDSAEQEKLKRINRAVQTWKKHLLDLTRRNRLLYFADSKLATIGIVSPKPNKLFQELVEKGKKLRFPIPDKAVALDLIQDDSGIAPENEKIPVKSGDLETSTQIRTLQSKLYRLKHDWQTSQEEQGIHTLYLTFGMLNWKDSEHGQKECKAPLILVPVGLEKDAFGGPYTLYFEDEDILVNPALSFKLEQNFGMSLPQLPDDDISWPNISEFINAVSLQVKSSGWYTSDELWLGRFTFEKLVMYHDLEESISEAFKCPIVSALSHADSLPLPTELPSTDNLDETIKPNEVFPVLDTDASQLTVLAKSRTNHHLLIQGPPGTGKSQTIVNLIAQALRDGKRVLFVSEKMAALEVVFRRLHQIGLSFACLEVHSHKSNKAKVIEELGKTLQERASYKSHIEDENFNSLVKRREVLNQYVRELHAKRGSLKYSLYKAHGIFACLHEVEDMDFALPASQILLVDYDQFEKYIENIRDLAKFPTIIENFDTHPWKGANIDPTAFSIEKRDTIIREMNILVTNISQIKQYAAKTADDLGFPIPTTMEQVERILKIIILLKDTPSLNPNWLYGDVKKLSQLLLLVDDCKLHTDNLVAARAKLGENFLLSLVDSIDIEAMLYRFKTFYGPVIRWLKKEYWQDLHNLKKHWKSPTRLTYLAALQGLETARIIQEENAWFNEQDSNHKDNFGVSYLREQSDWGKIKIGLQWTIQFLNTSASESAPKKLITELAKSSQPITTPHSIIQSLNNACSIVEHPLHNLENIFNSSCINGISLYKTPLDALIPWIANKTNPKDLQDWVGFERARNACDRSELTDFVGAVLEHSIPAEKIENVFKKRFWKSWISSAYCEAPLLNNFNFARHEEVISEFRELDKKLKHTTAQLIREKIKNTQPQQSAARCDASQIGILLREIQKKRRHRPLRRLFADIRTILPRLKPCFLMSPLSVAAYLTPGMYHFDLVIFDEASQIPPEDAIGAILRGSQIIVAGDSKQLPPTSFFQSEIDLDDYDENTMDETPLESILDECAALPGFMTTPLRWHYRSRHEELIAFSNKHFYDNSLVTFPSPHRKGEGKGVKFVHVENGFYDRGSTRCNRVEAKKVIDLVVDHLREHGKSSLGIITLSIAQENAILNEWEMRKVAEPELCGLTDDNSAEPFFIKSLEKIQGDERDYIFISVGYGPDANHHIHFQFGPLNRAGGERRLNVAITRARFETTIISSIWPHELSVAKLTNWNAGVGALQQYLTYANNKGVFPAETIGVGEPDSDFEIAVRNALVSRGFNVDSNVGFSGFRIDLAVQHPSIPTRYILGIECDGATYHSHKTARERDRLRQEILENLGWKIHRIWSTDWIRDPNPSIEAVISKIETLQKEKHVGIENMHCPGTLPTKSPELPKPASTQSNSARLPIYVFYPTERKRTPATLYKAVNGSKQQTELTELIIQIAKVEAPIHFDALCRRVTAIYGLEKLGTNIQEIVKSAIHTHIKLTRDGFVWLTSNKKLNARRPKEEDKPRHIDEICIEELAAATEYILKSEFGMPRETLIRLTARALGYDRTGNNIEKRIDKAIAMLIKAGRVIDGKEQITINDGCR